MASFPTTSRASNSPRARRLASRPSRQKQRRRLQVESLEDRRLLALIAYDGFEGYTAGAQLEPSAGAGLNGGTGFTGPWVVANDAARRAELTIASQALNYTNGEVVVSGGTQALQFLMTGTNITSQQVSRQIAQQTGTVYLSFLYQTVADVNAADDDFLQFGFHQTALPNPLVSAIDENGLWRVRNGTANSAASTVTTDVGSTYLVVLKIEKTGTNYNRTNLYINPSTLTEPAVANAVSTLDSTLANLAHFAIRRARHDAGDQYLIDEIRIGETYEDVVVQTLPPLEAHESFESYTVGAQLEDNSGLGLNGGAGFSGPWNVDDARRSDLTIVNASLEYDGGELLIDGGDQALRFATTNADIVVQASRPLPATGDAVYLSFLYQTTNNVGNEDDFMQLGFETAALTNPRVSVVDSANFWQVRSTTDSANTQNSNVATAVGSTYFVVMKAEKVTGSTYNRVSIYVNPTTGAEPATPSATIDLNSGLDLSTSAHLVFRRAFHESGDAFLIDEFRAANSYGGVVTLKPPQFLAYDGFEDYAASSLLEDNSGLGQNGGTGFLSPWDVTDARRNEMTVVNASLTYDSGDLRIEGGTKALQFLAATDNINEPIASRRLTGTDGDVYLSFLYRVTADAGDNDDFVQFGFDNTNLGVPRISAIDNTNTWQSRSTASAANSADSGITTDLDTTYFIVMKAEKTSGSNYNRVSIFVNPSTAAEPGTPSAIVNNIDSTLDLNNLAYLIIRRANNEAGDAHLVDEFRVGRTYEEVVVAKPPPPINPGDRVWTGAAGDRLWTTPGNWAGNDVPNSAAETAVFADDSPGLVNLGGGTIVVGGVKFQNSAGADFTLHTGTLDIDALSQIRGGTNIIDARLVTDASLVSEISAGTLRLTDTTNVLAGVMNVTGSAVLEAVGGATSSALGTSSLVVDGGTVRALPGGAGTYEGLDGRLLPGSTADLVNDGAIATALAATPAFSRTLFQGAIEFIPNADGSIANYFGTTTTNTNTFTMLFVGQFVAPTTGTYTFHSTQNENRAYVWLDRDGNGTFSTTGASGNELITSPTMGTDNTAANTVDLNAGTYNIVFALRDTGGNSGSVMQYGLPGVAATDLNHVRPLLDVGRFTFVGAAGPGNFTANDITIGPSGGTVDLGPGATGARFGDLDLTAGGTLNGTGEAVPGGQRNAIRFEGAVSLPGSGEAVVNPVSVDLALAGQISGGGGLTKNGAASLFITSGGNTYDGVTTSNSGALVVTENGGLGSASAGTVIATGSTLVLLNDVDYASLEALTLGGTLESRGSDNLWSGPITLSSNATLAVDNRSLEVTGGINLGSSTLTINTLDANNQLATATIHTGAIVGSGNLTKVGTGALELLNANSYSGTTTINGGVTIIGSGDAFGSSLLALQSGELRSNSASPGGDRTLPNNLSFTGNVTLGDPTNTGLLTFNGNGTLTGSRTLQTDSHVIFNGVIGGAANQNLAKTGNGDMTLAGANTFDGALLIGAGRVIATNSGSLGSGVGGTRVHNGAALELIGNLNLPADDVVLAGTGISGGGVLRADGNITLPGNIGLAGNATIHSVTPGTTLAIGGGVFREVDSDLTITGSGNVSIAGEIRDAAPLLFGDFQGRLFTSNNLGYQNDTAANATNNINVLAFTGTPANTATLSGPLVFANDAAFGNFFGNTAVAGNTTSFTAVFVTTITVSAAGTYYFAISNNDDQAAVWLDLNNDGVFTTASGERVQLTGGNNSTAVPAGVNLNPGTYTLAYVMQDNTGGSSVQGRFEPSALVQPRVSTQMLVATPGTAPTGSNLLLKEGTGALTLSGNNTYSGQTLIREGTLVAASNTALGNTAANTIIKASATLALDNTRVDQADNGALDNSANLSIAENILFENAYSNVTTSLQNIKGNNTLTGNITVTDAVTLPTTVGLELWLDASNLASIVSADGSLSDGDFISAWNDTLAGSNVTANNALQSDPAKQPTYVANSINGLPAIRFSPNNADDEANGDDLQIGNLNLGNNVSFFFVAQHAVQTNAPSSCCRPILTGDGDVYAGKPSNDYSFALHRNNLSHDFRFESPSSSTTVAGVGGPQDGSFHIYSMTRNGTTSNGTQLFKDGTNFLTLTVSGNATETNYSVGGQNNSTAGGGARQYTGDIPEIIAFNRTLSASERQAVEAYLEAKYFNPSTFAATITSQTDTLTIAGQTTFPHLTINGSGNVVVTGSLADASQTPGELVKEGTGTLNITTANSYSGGTRVNGGTLLVSNGSGSATGPANVLVQSGGTLGGTGIIGANVNVQGTINAGMGGSSIGTLTINGTLDLQSGSTLVSDINGASVDLVRVGNITIANNSVNHVRSAVVVPTSPVVLVNNLGANLINNGFLGATNTTGANPITLGGQPANLVYNFDANDGSLGDGNDIAIVFNQAPVANNDTPPNFLEDQVATGNVLTNDTDANGDPLTAVLVSGPSVAGVAFNLASNGDFSYTPQNGFSGQVTFTYQARDPSGELSNIATVTLNFTPVFDQPTLILPPGGVSGNEDTPIALNISANANDPSGPEAITQYQISGVVAGATLAVSGTPVTPVGGIYTVAPGQIGQLTYTAPPNASGAFTVNVTVFSSDGVTTGSDSGTLSINVAAVADPPTLTAPAAVSDGENSNIPLGISVTSVDSGTLTVTIDAANFPADARLVVGGVQQPVAPSYTLTTPAQWQSAAIYKPDNKPSDVFNVGITATSVEGGTTASSNTTTVVTFVNLAPDPEQVDVIINGESLGGATTDVTVVPGVLVTFVVSTTDPVFGATLDAPFSFTVDFDDGTVVTQTGVAAEGVQLSFSHTYTQIDQIYQPTLVVRDVEGLASDPLDLATVTVAQQAIIGDALFVGGTEGSDRIIVTASGAIRFNNRLLPNIWEGGRVVVLGNGGNDTITTSSVRFPIEFFGGAGNDYLAGGSSDDILDGGHGNDRILGGNGNDILLGGGGADRLYGGAGNDYGLGDHEIDLEFGEPTLFAFYDAFGGVEFEVELPLSESLSPGADTINGDAGDDVLYGGAMNDRLNGGAGNDLLRGGDGNDVLDGGHGDDFLLGEFGADTLYGRNGSDVMIGGLGVDTLNGGNGDDLLFGGDIFDGNTDEDVAQLWMLWRNFQQEEAIDELLAIGEDDELADTLNGERDIDWYILFERDRIRTTAETRAPNRHFEQF